MTPAIQQTAPRERPILFKAGMVKAILDGRKTQTRRIVKPQPTFAGFLSAERLVVDRNPWCAAAFKGTPATGVLGAGQPEWAVLSEDAFANVTGAANLKTPFTPGLRLWVKETFATLAPTQHEATAKAHRDHVVVRPDDDERVAVWYRADGEMPFVERLFSRDEDGIKWRPSIHMPRWASRIDLEITEVRVQRLQDISEEDARAEGITPLPGQHGQPGCWWTASVEAGPDLHARTPSDAYARLWDSINGKGSWASTPWVWAISFRRVRP